MQYLIYLFLLVNPTSSKYKILTWEDFKGTVDISEQVNGYSARTTTEWTLTKSIGDAGVYFVVSCRFVPEESWTITTDKRALDHEQTHLYISELNCEKFSKLLFKYQGCSEKQSEKVSKLFNYWWKESENLQKLYDKETQHGLSKSMQKTWEEMIWKDLIK